MPDKKISTIEDLAIMLQDEFASFHKRFDSLTDEILTIKIDIEHLKSTQANVAYRFEIEGLEKRLEKVEEKLGIKND